MQRQHRQQEGTKNFREIGSSSLAKEKIAIAKLPNYPFPRITYHAESEWPSERASEFESIAGTQEKTETRTQS